MEVFEREQSQSRRSSIKRPWEDGTSSPEKSNAWKPSLLPSIDAVPYRRGSTQEGGDGGSQWNGPGPQESFKKTKFEGHDYNTFPRQNSLSNGKLPLSRGPNFVYPSQGPLESPNHLPESSASDVPSHGRSNGDRLSDAHDQPKLCQRCTRLIIQTRETTTDGDSEDCDCKRSPELAWLSQECSKMLSNLVETLSTGISSEKREIRGSDHLHGSSACPPIETIGLKQTLNWILGRICHVNLLADQCVRQLPAASLPNIGLDNYRNGAKINDGSADIMKRRIDVDSDDLNDADPPSDTTPHIKRRSVTTLTLANEELPPLISHPDYRSSLPSIDGPGPRASMNPPPAPNRQLPSPPGRSLPSPTSLSFSSPSAPLYGINSHGVNLPPPSGLHPQSSNNYLPPITTSRSPDSALRDHTAALQHEVSIQKIALSSLQSEHDKLLAAFSRSQTRASALEKKHAVSDSEIISLTEDKLRLQAQVIELERDVEELTRSRDGFRQAAVQEGAQYVEIVQRATRLEEMAGEERKHWGKLRVDMERTIASLKAGRSPEEEGARPPNEIAPFSSRPDDMDTDTLASSAELLPDMKMELTIDSQPIPPTSEPFVPPVPQESVEDLKAEIDRLRQRCADVENALRAMRDDSRSMEDIVKSLVERANSTLLD